MNNQIRELNPTRRPNGERVNASSVRVEMELGDEELSKVSGGRGLALKCATGRHFAAVKITC
jgi:hypothetical protein